MSTTDRLSNLNSQREITDRFGQTVVLGNAVEDSALSIEARIVAAAVSESEAASSMSMTASITGDFTNGSFGIWAVGFDIAGAGLLLANGAAVAGVPFNAITQGLMAWGADGMLLNIQVFTATGEYTPTAGTAQIVVHCLGGGGGGGGCAATTAGQNSSGGGGGAGAMALGRITSGFSGVTVTVGAGGTGGAAGNNNGVAGGNTTFGTAVIGGGGTGGDGDTAGGVPRASAGGSGGAASGASSLFGAEGENGGQGYADSSVASYNGGGGSSAFGSGARSEIITFSVAGLSATGFGAGGSGGASIGEGAAAAGGDGSPGLVIIYEYNA